MLWESRGALANSDRLQSLLERVPPGWYVSGGERSEERAAANALYVDVQSDILLLKS